MYNMDLVKQHKPESHKLLTVISTKTWANYAFCKNVVWDQTTSKQHTLTGTGRYASMRVVDYT